MAHAHARDNGSRARHRTCPATETARMWASASAHCSCTAGEGGGEEEERPPVISSATPCSDLLVGCLIGRGDGERRHKCEHASIVRKLMPDHARVSIHPSYRYTHKHMHKHTHYLQPKRQIRIQGHRTEILFRPLRAQNGDEGGGGGVADLRRLVRGGELDGLIVGLCVYVCVHLNGDGDADTTNRADFA